MGDSRWRGAQDGPGTQCTPSSTHLFASTRSTLGCTTCIEKEIGWNTHLTLLPVFRASGEQTPSRPGRCVSGGGGWVLSWRFPLGAFLVQEGTSTLIQAPCRCLPGLPCPEGSLSGQSAGWGGADETGRSKGHPSGSHGPRWLVFPGATEKEKTILFPARISLAREWTLDFLAGLYGA